MWYRSYGDIYYSSALECVDIELSVKHDLFKKKKRYRYTLRWTDAHNFNSTGVKSNNKLHTQQDLLYIL